MERHFQDGTEPTILPHLRGCTGPCQQGRVACHRPECCDETLEESVFRLVGKLFLAIVLAAVLIVLGLSLT